MSNTYVCKSCGKEVKYPAKQDQDQQPLVDFDQHDDGVVIRIWKTWWVADEQGRPRQTKSTLPERIDHICTDHLNPPGVNFNLPATNDPDISF